VALRLSVNRLCERAISHCKFLGVLVHLDHTLRWYGYCEMRADNMREGWCGEDYLVLFDGREVPQASLRYDIARLLPGYEVLGLCGWDDLIVRDAAGAVFTVPTVPLAPTHLETFELPKSDTHLAHDTRFTGRIKWYLQPLAFGGDSNVGENLIWVDHDQHSGLVRWWNDKNRGLL
jgi:hypothetical protein